MFVTGVRVAVVFAVVLGSQVLIAHAPFEYRGYTLGSTLAAVIDASGEELQAGQWGIYLPPPAARDAVVPVFIQELAWTPPYQRSQRAPADPVREILFGFYGDRLYRIAITYDPDRTEGLTNGDVMDSISATYGVQVTERLSGGPGLPASGALVATAVIAHWEDFGSILTLSRGEASLPFQLMFISKAVNPDGHEVTLQTLQLETRQATERQLTDRQQAFVRARQAGRTYGINKAAFRP